jgi:muconate cycloisomerase
MTKVSRVRSRVVAHEIVSPQRMGHFDAAHTHSTLLVTIEDVDGVVGYGEASGWSVFSGDSARASQRLLHETLAPALIGRPSGAWRNSRAVLDRLLLGQPNLKAGVEFALLDLAARTAGRSTAELLGGAVRTEVPMSYSLSLQQTPAESEIVADLYERGWRYFKLKTGVSPPRLDSERLYALRAAAPDAILRLDFNERSTPAHLAVLSRVALEVGVEYFEQPGPAGSVPSMTAAAAHYGFALSIDESLRTATDLLDFAGRPGALFASLKSGRLGGPGAMMFLGELAHHLGVLPYAGSLSESRLGCSAALQVFCALPSLNDGNDFYYPLLIALDTWTQGGMSVVGGTARLPTGPGCGATVDEALFAGHDDVAATT